MEEVISRGDVNTSSRGGVEEGGGEEGEVVTGEEGEGVTGEEEEPHYERAPISASGIVSESECWR